jgi:glutathione S-transferase
LSWKPQNPQTWTHLQQCLVLNDGVFKQSLDRYKYPNRYPDEDVRDAKMRATSHLMNYDAILEKQAFLSGPQMGLLDACVLPFVRQFAKTDEVYFQSQPWAALQRWLYGLLQSDGFLSIMSQSQV